MLTYYTHTHKHTHAHTHTHTHAHAQAHTCTRSAQAGLRQQVVCHARGLPSDYRKEFCVNDLPASSLPTSEPNDCNQSGYNKLKTQQSSTAGGCPYPSPQSYPPPPPLPRRWVMETHTRALSFGKPGLPVARHRAHRPRYCFRHLNAAARGCPCRPPARSRLCPPPGPFGCRSVRRRPARRQSPFFRGPVQGSHFASPRVLQAVRRLSVVDGVVFGVRQHELGIERHHHAVRLVEVRPRPARLQTPPARRQ